MPGTDTEWNMGANTSSGDDGSSQHSLTARSSSWHAAWTTERFAAEDETQRAEFRRHAALQRLSFASTLLPSASCTPYSGVVELPVELCQRIGQLHFEVVSILRQPTVGMRLPPTARVSPTTKVLPGHVAAESAEAEAEALIVRRLRSDLAAEPEPEPEPELEPEPEPELRVRHYRAWYRMLAFIM